MDHTYEDPRAAVVWNSKTKKITVTDRKAGFSKTFVYSFLTLKDLRDLARIMKDNADRTLESCLDEWENL